jgi:probable rRNA maturation factor
VSEIDVSCEDVAGMDEEAVRADAHAVLVAAGLSAPELSVLLVDDARMRALNATWRGKDVTTDVLSFPQQEPPVRGGLLGDVVISVPTAQAQANALGHDLLTELRVLLVHGICHLLGHDHELGEEPAAEMAREEVRLLGALGVDGTRVGLVERARHEG